MSKNRVLGKGLSALLNGADLKGMPLPAAATAPGAETGTLLAFTSTPPDNVAGHPLGVGGPG